MAAAAPKDVCASCGLPGHKSTRSQKCPNHVKKAPAAAAAPIAPTQPSMPNTAPAQPPMNDQAEVNGVAPAEAAPVVPPAPGGSPAQVPAPSPGTDPKKKYVFNAWADIQLLTEGERELSTCLACCCAPLEAYLLT